MRKILRTIFTVFAWFHLLLPRLKMHFNALHTKTINVATSNYRKILLNTIWSDRIRKKGKSGAANSNHMHTWARIRATFPAPSTHTKVHNRFLCTQIKCRNRTVYGRFLLLSLIFIKMFLLDFAGHAHGHCLIVHCDICTILNQQFCF